MVVFRLFSCAFYRGEGGGREEMGNIPRHTCNIVGALYVKKVVVVYMCRLAKPSHWLCQSLFIMPKTCKYSTCELTKVKLLNYKQGQPLKQVNPC